MEAAIVFTSETTFPSSIAFKILLFFSSYTEALSSILLEAFCFIFTARFFISTDDFEASLAFPESSLVFASISSDDALISSVILLKF